MKLCCAWCSLIYTPKDPTAIKDPKFGTVYCSKGCRDANKLFLEKVDKDFQLIERQRHLRLK